MKISAWLDREARKRKVAFGYQPETGEAGARPPVSIAAAIQTVRSEIECPTCRCRHILVEGDKAKCAGCSSVWNWRNPPKMFKGA